MANFTIYKKVLMRGEKGDTGGGGVDTTVPQAGIIAYKGDEIPEGYILYSEVPDGVLTHITATYTQTATITDASSLDELRPDLVVKAYYYDDETGITSDYVITDYTLSGTLEVGTSTITASYKGFSDSFDVTVEESITYLYKWDFTQSLTDEKQGVVATLGGNAIRDNNGVSVSDNSSYVRVDLPTGLLFYGNTIEIDFGVTDFKPTRGNLFCVNMGTTQYSTGLRFNENNQWVSLNNGNSKAVYTGSNDANIFNGKTLKMYMESDGKLYIYANDELKLVLGSFLSTSDIINNFTLGYNSNAFYNMTITGVRIYETPTGGN